MHDCGEFSSSIGHKSARLLKISSERMIMKKALLIFTLILCTFQAKTNSVYESKLKEMAIELSSLIERRGIEKIALWNLQPIDSSQLRISKHLSEDLSVYLTNASTSLQLFDRQFLDQVLEELRLQQSGLIDQTTAKQLGAFTCVEAIVTGQYSLLGNKLKIWVKVIETESAFQIAALKSELPWNDRSFLKTITAKKKDRASRKAISLKRKRGVGSLFLSNKKIVSISVRIKSDVMEKTILVGGNSSSTIYDLPSGTYDCFAKIPLHKEDLESFQVKIMKSRRSRKTFKGYNPFKIF